MVISVFNPFKSYLSNVVILVHIGDSRNFKVSDIKH